MATIGLDYASVDKNSAPDFAAAKGAGVRFVIPRAVYGRRVKDQVSSNPVCLDPVWARDRDAIKSAGLKRSAYLFVCFEQPGVQTPTPEVQAQAFIDYVKLTPGSDFVPFIDIEESSPMGSSRMYDWCLRVATKIKDAYGAWPGMYTSARVWAENLQHHSPGPLLNCPLWLAKPWPWLTRTPIHLDGAPAYSPTPIPEFGVGNWWTYQFQGDAIGCPGFTSTVDASRFHTISEGAKGAQVVWSQKRLGVSADGIFGPKTKNAVVELQKKYGLAADGVIGIDTFTSLCWQPIA